MQAIGYKEFVSALNGRITVEEAADEVKRASRRYAKRQLTWFRRNKSVRWLIRTGTESQAEILSMARQLLTESDN